MAPRISIFSIVLGAKYSFYVKSIATYAPAFFVYNNSVLAIVDYIDHIYKIYKNCAITFNLHDKLFHSEFATSFQQWNLHIYYNVVFSFRKLVRFQNQ